MRTDIRAVAVVHTLVPGSPEWPARLDEAARALDAELVGAIIVTGGRDGLDGYNNPVEMRNYLLEKGVPAAQIFWRPVADSELQTSANTVDSGGEVEVALRLILEHGLESAIIVPISNPIHMVRILRIWRARARKLGLKLRLQPLTIPNMLGWKWTVMEVGLNRLYTMIDPGWTGPIVEWMRKKRRQGFKLGAAGGSGKK